MYDDPIQGSIGNCYIIASMGAAAEFPELIKSIFLTKEKNEAGIVGLRLFIRGKPWVITIDDELLFNGDRLYYARASQNNEFVWGPLLEKAWSKIKGNYLASNGGFI